MSKPVLLCDIDGTLADLSHRLKFIEQKPQDWSGFFSACPEDAPIKDVIALVKRLSTTCDIIMVTGRSDEIEEKTIEWLGKFRVPYLTIYMRKAGDHRQDNIVKSELLDEIRHDWDDREILGVFEDRKQVVDMYRSKGLRVYQVAEGNF